MLKRGRVNIILLEKDNINSLMNTYVEKTLKPIAEDIKQFINVNLHRTLKNNSFKGAVPHVEYEIIGKKIKFFYVMSNRGNKRRGHYIWHIINAGRKSSGISDADYQQAISRKPARFPLTTPPPPSNRTYTLDTLPRRQRAKHWVYSSKAGRDVQSNVWIYYGIGAKMTGFKARRYYKTIYKMLKVFEKKYKHLQLEFVLVEIKDKHR